MRAQAGPVRLGALVLLLASIALVSGHDAFGQIPDKFSNLRVLPKKIPKDQLVQTMRGFSLSLGVRCEHCHAKQAGGPERPGPPELDFASDDLKPKRTAREMMRMVDAINGRYLSRLDLEPKLSVQCVTCHRGVPRPETLGSLLQRTAADSGVTVAVARYRALRNKYHGSGSYDFTETTLNMLGEGLLRQGKAADARTFLELNAEENAGSSWLQMLLGEAYLATGDKDMARAAFEKALATDPNNPRLKKRIEELQGGSAKP